MSFGDGLKPGQPFIIPRGELSSRFRLLSPQEIAALEGSTEKPEVEPKEGVTIEQAETIMGADFFGPNDVQKEFRIVLESKDIPAIPFSETELERAKDLGQFLILRVNRVTMLRIHEVLQGRFTREGSGNVLMSIGDQWKLDSKFFTTETPQIGWALSGKSLVPESTNKNYLQQSRLLCEYLTNEVFKDYKEIPQPYYDAIIQCQNYYDNLVKGKTKQELEALLGGANWQTYAKELENLAINQLTRQSPVEALYDIVAFYLKSGKKTKKRILERENTWTKRRASDGGLVNLGDFDTDGASVRRPRPNFLEGNLGVVFSRTQ